MFKVYAGETIMNEFILVHCVKRVFVIIVQFIAGCYIEKYIGQCAERFAGIYLVRYISEGRYFHIIRNTAGDFRIVITAI